MSEIIAMVPQYLSGVGNVTIVHEMDNTHSDARRLSSIILYLAKTQLLDLTELKKLLKEVLGITKNCPLIIGDQAFVYVKTRQTIGKNDGCHSLININYVKNYENGAIVFDNELLLQTQETDQSIRRIFHRGQLAQYVVQNKEEFMR